MADPAAQFPVVSSSSFPSSPSSGRPQPGGCRGGSVSCTDPPTSSSSSSSFSSSSSSSSSQPVSLFAASPVRELLLWRDVRRSAVAFVASLVLLLSLATLSAVTVVAHVALALLCVTISLRVYRAVVQALQKSHEGHPFRAYLDLDVTLSPERFQAQVTAVAQHVNRALRLLLRLFLVEDLVDSLELALTMWLLTYVGAVFNGITLLILADLLAFSLPPLYEKYKVQIDHSVGIARSQTKDLVAKIQAKLPCLAKKKPE
ncbi:reticulon-3-like isoform X3 [Manacus candei]|uniref:reticulon-3-like isoform X3 n=1 Tax=Manacus candei TaxID=415023 RepID=UPI002226C582|nr:reticulon-3-like isoform X3 [Manacus candei]